MNSEEKKFLATTAIEEFWDTSKPIVFLGERCRLYRRRSFWEPLKGVVLPSPWEDKERLYAAFKYVDDFYECMLPILADKLNTIHGVNFGKKYWRILIGPWLFHYVHVLYDRYLSLKGALNKYPNLVTIGLSEESFVIPQDYNEFIKLISDDSYNLQLYTKILDLLGEKSQKKSYKVTQKYIESEKEDKRSFKSYLYQFIKKFFHEFFVNKKTLLIFNPYFTSDFGKKILEKERENVRLLVDKKVDCKSILIDLEMRKKLKTFDCNLEGFEPIFNGMLPFDLPLIYLEGYPKLKKEVEKDYPVNPKAIFSANAWYSNEYFKQLAAISSEKETILIGTQHGGIYGIHNYMAVEKHELAITDQYYSWGWEQLDCAAKVIPFFANKMAGVKEMSANNKNEDILFMVTSMPRYFFRFQYFNSDAFINYINEQFSFVDMLDSNRKHNLRVRLYFIDFDWGCSDRLKDMFPEIILEDMTVPFLERINNCRLVVLDHLFTSFMEVMALNKPVISFAKTYQLKSEARVIFDELRNVGILYDSPKDAAMAINSIYIDVETWWNDSKRQAARKKFCNYFARVSSESDEKWIEEFERLIKN